MVLAPVSGAVIGRNPLNAPGPLPPPRPPPEQERVRERAKTLAAAEAPFSFYYRHAAAEKLRREKEEAAKKAAAPDDKQNTKWVACDRCSKWRRLPPRKGRMPKTWFCEMNPDSDFNSCAVAEEELDDVEVEVE